MQSPPTPNLDVPARGTLEAWIAEVRERPAPTTTLYLDVHAGEDPRAPAQRADAALRTTDLTREDRDAVLRHLREVLRGTSEGHLAYAIGPGAASGDADPAWAFVRVAPPLPGGAREVAVAQGRPWTAPIELLLATRAPVVATYADAHRARLFVADLGEVVEAASYVHALDPTGWRRFAEHATGMPGRPARGGSGQDAFEARTAAWTADFVRDVVAQVDAALATRSGARLALLGDAPRVAQVEEALPPQARRAVLLRGSAPADPDAPPGAWEAPLLARIDDARRREDDALVQRLSADGVAGLAPVLHALVDQDLAVVAVPAHVDVDVVHCLEDGWIAEDEAAARRVCPDGPIEWAPLKTFLLDAAKRGRADVHVVDGEAGRRLAETLGAVAGLPRSHAG
ncbi:MAG: VLRF1 family aeRF1-type release factor [Trueperaceae bacterium]|nr:VLRF1 family aeRF1-type release factor [Trueperaceae bacterium]